MDELLSLWRSPIDRVAVVEAHRLAARQPRCDKTIDQLPPDQTPTPQDVVALWRAQNNTTVGVTLQTLSAFFGIGPGGPISAATDFSALTIFNYGAYGGLPSNTATQNDVAMVRMVGAMGTLQQPYGAGLGLFQGTSYQIDAQNFPWPDQSIMLGCGAVTGPNSATFAVTASSSGVPNTLFTVPGQAAHTSGGVLIKNIGISYHQGSNASSVALQLNGWHTIAEDVTFYNAPCAAVLGGLHCGLRYCTIEYQCNATNGPNGGATAQTALPMVVMDAPQCFVDHGEFQQLPINQGGCTGIAGISIEGHGGGEHNMISHTHLSDYDYGITWGRFGGSSQYAKVHDCEIAAAMTCIWLGLTAGTGSASTAGNRFTDVTGFQTIHATLSTDCVYIDPYLSGQTIEDQEFKGCTFYQSLRDGYRIRGGHNIRILGGTVAGNTNANINITSDSAAGPVGLVTIYGVTIGANYSNAAVKRTALYGLLINLANLGSNSQILVDHCPFDGTFLTAPVGGIGTLPGSAQLFITNCVGYNDQRKIITTIITPGQPVSAADFGYYGPSLLSFANATTIQYQVGEYGIAVTQSSACIYVPPGVKVTLSAVPAAFSWIGY